MRIVNNNNIIMLKSIQKNQLIQAPQSLAPPSSS